MKKDDDTQAILEVERPKCKQCDHFSYGFCVKYDAAVHGNAQACSSSYKEPSSKSHPSYIKLS